MTNKCMVTRLLQINLNHARQAQDLFSHHLDERDIDLGIVAEPLWIPDGPSWVASINGSVAIVKGAANNSPPLRVIERGMGYAAARWRPITVINCYAPP